MDDTGAAGRLPTPDDRAVAICGVRDARDIILYACGHYLRLGFDCVSFVDDGSDDGTYEFLKRLSRLEPRVRVRRLAASADFKQSEYMTDEANARIEEGFRLIFPFDVDEFWNIELRAIRRAAKNAGAGLFKANWVHIIQSRNVRGASRFGVLRAKYRAPIVAKRKDLTASGRPRLFHTLPKVAFKSSEPVSIEFGQHSLTKGPTETLADSLEMFHLAVRSPLEIERRKAVAPRYLRQIRSMMPKTARLGPVEFSAWAENWLGTWETNSADSHGCIAGDDGKVFPLIPDSRLRWMLTKAWIYMALRHPFLAF